MIVLLTNEFPPTAGGVATYSYSLARAVDSLEPGGIAIIAPRAPGDAGLDSELPFRVHRVPEFRISVFRHLARTRMLNKVIQDASPSVLWAVDWRTGLVIATLAMYYGLPYAVTAHGSEILLAADHRARKALALQTYRRASAVLADSSYTKRLLVDLGVAGDGISVMPLGVDPDIYGTVPACLPSIIQRHGLACKKVVLTLSRLTPRKGHDTVIRALPTVLQVFPDTVYLIAGQGNDEKRLRTLAADLDVEDHVIFAGSVSETEKPGYYHACDVYAMLSRREGLLVEGFGLTLLEAAAAGKPVVAGRHGGVEDAVINGKTGILVDPCDSGQLAVALLELLTDPDRALYLGRNGRKRVETEANWDQVARHTLEVFAQIL